MTGRSCYGFGFVFCLLIAIPVYGDVQHENQEGHQIEQVSQPELDTAIEIPLSKYSKRVGLPLKTNKSL